MLKSSHSRMARLSRFIVSSTVISSISVLSMFSFFAHAEEQRTLNLYNWTDYVAPNTIADFEKKTGIKVVYDMFDSNEILESKLMAGNTGFDLVIPTSNFLAKQLEIGLYQPLDRAQLPLWSNFDPEMLALVAKDDPDNQYGFPYLWSSTGIGFNVDKVKAALGDDAPTDSWALIFDKQYAEKLKGCGITWIDDPSEMFAIALNYLGFDPNSTDSDEYVKATELLQSVRQNVRYIHSSSYINDLANGDICVAVGWSGDIYLAANRAKEANNNVNIDYAVPKEGTVASFDMFAIPKDAKNVKEAHEFLNYLLEPQVIADISNYVFYANANLASKPLLDPELTSNPNIYPPLDVQQKMFSLSVKSPKVERNITRAWTTVLTGK